MPETLSDMVGEPGAIIAKMLRHRAKIRELYNGKPGPTKFICETCGEFSDLYMLVDDLWCQIHPSGYKGFLCLHCAQDALGRPFALTDFKAVLANLPIAIGYEIGRRSCD